ncbi:MAG: hypothetical protein MH137_03325 [Flavobacteriales bacterium]|nr:hypothetical protein [Flavobacteriales bacterium]
MKSLFLTILILQSFSLFAQVKFKAKELQDPIKFGRLVVHTSQEGTLSQWENLLHKDFVELGTEFTMFHFSVWRDAFKPVWDKHNKKSAIPVTLTNEKLLKIEGISVIIIKENGRYYINER